MTNLEAAVFRREFGRDNFDGLQEQVDAALLVQSCRFHDVHGRGDEGDAGAHELVEHDAFCLRFPRFFYAGTLGLKRFGGRLHGLKLNQADGSILGSLHASDALVDDVSDMGCELAGERMQ